MFGQNYSDRAMMDAARIDGDGLQTFLLLSDDHTFSLIILGMCINLNVA